MVKSFFFLFCCTSEMLSTLSVDQNSLLQASQNIHPSQILLDDLDKWY